MPLIPDLNPNVPGRALPVAPDLGAAMAPGRALERVGSGISAVGETVGAFQLQMQKARDEGVKSRAALAVQQELAEHEKYRMENPDETTWQADIDARLDRVRQTFQGERLSPFGRAELDAQFDGWGQDYRNRTMLDATKQSVARSRQALTNEVRARQDAGDFEGAEKRLREASGSVLLPEEAESDIQSNAKLRKDYEAEQRFSADIAAIDEDPFPLRGKYEGEKPDGENEEEWLRKKQQFRISIARHQQRIVDQINDGLASGKITRPDQLEEWKDELGDAAVLRLQNSVKDMVNEGRKAMVGTPAYQARIIGAVSASIAELDPKDITRRVEIEARLRDISPGPSKDLLTADLKRKLGDEPEDYSAMSRARKLIKVAFDHGIFGEVAATESQTTADVLKDDFLMDGAKLQALGITKEWADKVQDPEAKDTDRVAIFTEAMRNRPKDAKITADDYTMRAAEAIVSRKKAVPKTTEERNAEMRNVWDALSRRGALERELAEWAKAHPDGDVEAELMRRLGDADSARLIDAAEADGGWFDDIGDFSASGEEDMTTLPGMEPGAPGSTNALLPPR